MVVDRKTLFQTYSAKSDEELLRLHNTGTLTELAYEVLEEELVKRGLSIPEQSTEIEPEERVEQNSRTAYVVSMIFIVLVSNVISQIFIHPNREERLKTAIEKATETHRITSMQNFMAGKEVSSVELMLIIPEVVDATNKELPMMVDDITRFDWVDIRGGKAIHRYTVLDWDAVDTDTQSFRDLMHNKLMDTVCNDKWSWLLLKNDFTLQYSWYMENDSHIADVAFQKSDCQLALKNNR